MTIGPDIEEALDEVGIAIIIDPAGTPILGEYIYYKPNAQVTKPFIREFFLEGWFPYNSQASAGSIVEFDITSDRYLVMNWTPQIFENAVIKYDSVLYKTNITATIYRPSEVRDPDTLKIRTVWTPVAVDTDLLLTTPLHGHDLETDEEIGLLGIQNHELYAPESLGIKTLDRIRFVNGSTVEYYRVEAVKLRRYKDVAVFDVGEDTRPYTTSTTTTTTTSSSTTTTTA